MVPAKFERDNAAAQHKRCAEDPFNNPAGIKGTGERWGRGGGRGVVVLVTSSATKFERVRLAAVPFLGGEDRV